MRLEIRRKQLYKIKLGDKGNMYEIKCIYNLTSCTCECILQNQFGNAIYLRNVLSIVMYFWLALIRLMFS